MNTENDNANRSSGVKPGERKVDPSTPQNKSPVVWMGLVMVTLVILTTLTMWGREKVSIKASPVIPELSEQAQHGRQYLNTHCAECHGVDGTGGSKKGPPILHPMYRRAVYPDHHFKKMVREGKREKNWRFGPMPAYPEIADKDIDAVIRFVREVQDATNVE